MDVTDYHNFTKEDTPEAERRKLNVGDIWVNSTTCNLCGETIRSKNRHDFHFCRCGNVAVDGGSWYSKRSFKNDIDTFEDTIIYFDDAKVKCYGR